MCQMLEIEVHLVHAAVLAALFDVELGADVFPIGSTPIAAPNLRERRGVDVAVAKTIVSVLHAILFASEVGTASPDFAVRFEIGPVIRRGVALVVAALFRIPVLHRLVPYDDAKAIRRNGTRFLDPLTRALVGHALVHARVLTHQVLRVRLDHEVVHADVTQPLGEWRDRVNVGRMLLAEQRPLVLTFGFRKRDQLGADRHVRTQFPSHLNRPLQVVEHALEVLGLGAMNLGVRLCVTRVDGRFDPAQSLGMKRLATKCFAE